MILSPETERTSCLTNCRKNLRLRVLGNEEILSLFTWVFIDQIIFEPVTRGFELLARGFELMTCGFELVTRGFKLLTRGFKLITRDLNS